jgi:hypothetical protein
MLRNVIIVIPIMFWQFMFLSLQVTGFMHCSDVRPLIKYSLNDDDDNDIGNNNFSMTINKCPVIR